MELSSLENARRDREYFDGFSGEGGYFTARIYTFSHLSATYGYLSDPGNECKSAFERAGVDLVRRETGGGIALHNEDTCLSIFFGCGVNPGYTYHETAGFLMELVARALESGTGLDFLVVPDGPFVDGESNYCFNSSSRFDIYHGGTKIAGCAGRVARGKSLIQIQLLPMTWPLNELFSLTGYTPEGLCVPDNIKIFIQSSHFLEYIRIGLQSRADGAVNTSALQSVL